MQRRWGCEINSDRISHEIFPYRLSDKLGYFAGISGRELIPTSGSLTQVRLGYAALLVS